MQLLESRAAAVSLVEAEVSLRKKLHQGNGKCLLAASVWLLKVIYLPEALRGVLFFSARSFKLNLTRRSVCLDAKKNNSPRHKATKHNGRVCGGKELTRYVKL